MTEDIYTRLRAFLDRLPGGFPATESGVELKLLKKLFTPEEAEIALKLTPLPEPAGSIAAKLGLSEAAAAAKLENMAKQGLIYRFRAGETALYMATQLVIGIYEFHLNTLDRELAELMEEYLPALQGLWAATKTKQLRVVPIGSAVDATPSVGTYDRAREMVKAQKLIAVAPCICQKEMTLLGEKCERPRERCMSFGMAAEYYIENGMGRPISVTDALGFLDLAEKHALVLSPTNAEEPMSICCCCGCCCGILRALRTLPRPADHVNSAFQARIDPELCSNCGACLERCQIGALTETEGATVVDEARCIGCGLCLATCPEQAISFQPKPRLAPLPKNVAEVAIRIMRDRGLI